MFSTWNSSFPSFPSVQISFSHCFRSFSMLAARHGVRSFRICLDQSINVTSFGSTFSSTSLLVTRYQSSSEPTVPKISSTAVLPITVVPEIR